MRKITVEEARKLFAMLPVKGCPVYLKLNSRSATIYTFAVWPENKTMVVYSANLRELKNHGINILYLETFTPVYHFGHLDWSTINPTAALLWHHVGSFTLDQLKEVSQ